MRFFHGLLVSLVWLVSPTWTTAASHAAAPPAAGDAAALRDRVARLASPALDGRATGTAGDAAARAYLVGEFHRLGLVPGVGDSYEQAFVADGRATANVVGYLQGTGDAAGGEIILVGAHHDHLGDGHLGANDNASGIAAL